MSFFGPKNLSIFAIPAAWVLAYAPHTIAVQLLRKDDRYNNANPKKSFAEAPDLYKRMSATTSNGIENLALFASAIVRFIQ